MVVTTPPIVRVVSAWEGDREENRVDNIRSSSPCVSREARGVEHNYVDHYRDPPAKESPRIGVGVAFPQILHAMMKAATSEGFEHIVCWQPHGRAFRVNDKVKFVEDIMPSFFQQTKLTSFHRQLNLYGFVRLTASGDDRGAYYHELFLRGRPDLVSRMYRTKVKGIGRRSAIHQEPDFYGMEFCLERSKSNLLSVTESIPTPAPVLSPARVLATIDGDQCPVLKDERLGSNLQRSGSHPISPDRSTSRPSIGEKRTRSLNLTEGDVVFFEGLKFCYVDCEDGDLASQP